MTTTAQGKFAGSMKKLIGTSFKGENNINALKSYKQTESTLLSPVNDPVLFTVAAFKKANTYIIVFSRKENEQQPFYILDVIEIKNVKSNQAIKTVDCHNGNEEASNIVAFVQKRKDNTPVILKAWRCNMDKIRFDEMPTKLVHCEGDEQF